MEEGRGGGREGGGKEGGMEGVRERKGEGGERGGRGKGREGKGERKGEGGERGGRGKGRKGKGREEGHSEVRCVQLNTIKYPHPSILSHFLMVWITQNSHPTRQCKFLYSHYKVYEMFLVETELW